MILFVYDFQVQVNRLEEFQQWAASKGMKFWEKQAGVIRYQTFRKNTASLMSHRNKLLGSVKSLDVFSEVEIQDEDHLERIIDSSEFQQMQEELSYFIDPNSLTHSVLHQAYDSMESRSVA
ncbi:hypothetical protein [Lyngbya confervoides]|uniref:Uncharacterized protein n=1 Tax=Lyngbya confervoides BDU141951 TaxID=1574623 RepID=A0ABD4T514_9CYAN|nr:hypothetical protein [Lyngbya confervoides]MCM1983886.1 hypothetical protein [Lyngbya confervoides BDU141951]